jgi:hypothetical protein
MVLLLLACAEEPSDTGASTLPTLDPPPAGEGFQVTMFGTAPAFSEVWLCEVYDLPTDDYMAVNWVEYLQNAGTHHMSLSTTFLSGVELAPGTYDCNDIYNDPSLMEGMVIMFGSQGAAEGTLQLPEGVAAGLPASIQIVHEIHYVNTTDTDLELYSYLNGWSIPAEDVVDTIWGGSVRDETIAIPPASEHSEWSRCVMNMDAEVHFLASHTHGRGRQFTIAPFDGTTTGEVFYSNTDWHDPMIVQYNPPLSVSAGQGFEFACTWENEGDTEVNYGLTADDEMCNMAIVFTPGDPSAACEVVETSDGVLWK